MSVSNQEITFKGNPIEVGGASVQVGQSVPEFKVVGLDMSDVTQANFDGKVVVISSVPSLDTPVCAVQTKRFNEEISKLGNDDVVVLTVSRDLPMAQKRWCGAEGVENVVCASDFKYHSFAKTFGVELPTLGLLARAIFVVDKKGSVQHVEYVSEIAEEPNYDSVIEKVKELV